MKFKISLEGYILSLKAEGYSQSTIELYTIMLTTLNDFLSNPEVAKITSNDLTRYFAFLRSDYKPRRQGGSQAPLSGSTLQNHWKAIKSFFNWAEVELSLKTRPDFTLKLPQNNPKAILPFSKEEVESLLAEAEFSRQSSTNRRKPFKMKRFTADRDIALIILLLDTGIRSGEASRLNIADLNIESGELYIAPFGYSMRKTKSRVVPVGKSARKALWRYLASRLEKYNDDPLFLSKSGKRLTTNAIRQLLRKLGEKANILDCHPHRLRHTFAVEYLRNDGDIFTLQMILGHSSLDMVRRYLQLVKADVINAHRRSSPADKWKLK